MKKYLLLFLFGILLQSCQTNSNQESPNQDDIVSKDEVQQEITKTQDSKKKSITKGQHCFKLTDKTTTAFVVLNLKEEGTVSGTLISSIEDHTNSYFTNYDMTLDEESTWTNEGIDAKLTIKVDGETETEDQMWRFDNEYLIIKEDIYTPCDCKDSLNIKK